MDGRTQHARPATARRQLPTTKIARAPTGREALPGIDRLAQVADQRAELHHDLDEFLKDAENRRPERGRRQPACGCRRGQRERGAQRRQHRRSDDQDDRPDGTPRPKVSVFCTAGESAMKIGRRSRNLHRQRQQGEKPARDAAGEQARQAASGQNSAEFRARRDRGAGAERDRDQRGMRRARRRRR